MRGPGSLNNSGKLFMEHALFIHRLRVRSPVQMEEKHMLGETERMPHATTQRKRKKNSGRYKR